MKSKGDSQPETPIPDFLDSLKGVPQTDQRRSGMFDPVGVYSPGAHGAPGLRFRLTLGYELFDCFQLSVDSRSKDRGNDIVGLFTDGHYFATSNFKNYEAGH